MEKIESRFTPLSSRPVNVRRAINGWNKLSLSGVSLGRTKFNVSASASSRFLAPLDEAFESIRNGGAELVDCRDGSEMYRGDLQAEFLVPFGIERGALDGRGSDEFGRQSGVEAVALLPSGVQAAAVAAAARAVAVVVADARGGPDATETRSPVSSDVVLVATGRRTAR